MRQEADRDGSLTSNPVVIRQLEAVLMTQLLLTQPNNYTPALRGDQPRVAPLVIRRAMELMEERAADPLTVKDVAKAAGVGVRTLQEGFRRHLGTTPCRYLRDIRLDRVHADLAACAPGSATVAEVACRWGFFHFGRFAAAYREQFGESPSLTLRR
jgi:transcriptional regulator GlxA family with amidase domain